MTLTFGTDEGKVIERDYGKEDIKKAYNFREDTANDLPFRYLYLISETSPILFYKGANSARPVSTGLSKLSFYK